MTEKYKLNILITMHLLHIFFLITIVIFIIVYLRNSFVIIYFQTIEYLKIGSMNIRKFIVSYYTLGY